MKYRNINLGGDQGERDQWPNQIGATVNADWLTAHAAGWRECPPVPELQAGYTRISKTLTDDGWQVVDRLTAEIEAEQAAAEAEAEQAEIARRNTPLPFDQPIETPALVLQSLPGEIGVGLVAADDGTLASFIYHASPIPSPEEIALRKSAALTAETQHKARIAAIATDLDQVEAALDQVDVTTTGPLGVAIAATTGANKTALQEVRKTLVDLKAAAKNLRQASEKVRREIR